MIEPLRDLILIKPVEKTEKMVGSFIAPANKQESNEAEVIAVGDTVKGIEVGDVVIYNKWGGVPVPEGKTTLLLLQEKDIYAIRQ